MCYGAREHGRHGFGRRFGKRWYNREEVLPRLEEHQKDLEQELADVSDLLKRLREEQPKETATV